VDQRFSGRGRRGISTIVVGDHATALGPLSLGQPLAPPIYQTSTFAFSSAYEMLDVFAGTRPGYVYSRYDNPTVAAAEQKIRLLEDGARALLFSSGMASIHAVLWSMLAPGDRLVAGQDLYGGSAELMDRFLPRGGIEVERVDLGDADATAQALAKRPRAIYFETPTNPRIRVLDGPRIVAQAQKAGARVIVDNTLATPVLQNPIHWGADVVVHSATKYLGGHSDITLGTAVVSSSDDAEGIERCRRAFGSTPDPFAAWLLNRGLMTLVVRVRAQSDSAGVLASRLQNAPSVLRVDYPGLSDDPCHDLASRLMRGPGAMFAFELRGGTRAVMEFMAGLRIVRLASSLGGPESLVSHPATSSHAMLSSSEREALGINDGLVRMSVGLEDVDDLIADLESSLNGVVQGIG
jgi:methionine-gamma-lyase